MTRKTISGVTAAAIATNGNLTGSYPTGYTRGDFLGGRHKLVVLQKEFTEPAGINVTLNAANWSFQYKGNTTIPAGSSFFVELDQPGQSLAGITIPQQPNTPVDMTPVPRITGADVVVIPLGSPAAAAANAAALTQNVTAVNGTGTLTLNGTLVVNNVAVFDVPRAPSITSDANLAAVTVTVNGYDAYGVPMTQSRAGPNNTTVNMTRAFANITSVTTSANATNIAIGTCDVLGMPVRLPGSAGAFILRELENEATIAAGTAVAALAPSTAANATNGDVRGTYDPNSACDGSKAFSLVCVLLDPTDLGNPQYSA